MACGWKTKTLSGALLAGGFYYILWKGWSFAVPYVLRDLELTKSDAGTLSSSFLLAYAASKFVVAPLADVHSCRKLIVAGLVGASISNFAFALGVRAWSLAFAVFCGGMLQGFNWPPVSHLLVVWLPPSERGTWWGVASTARSAMGAVMAAFVPLLLPAVGWRETLFGFSLTTLLGAVLLWAMIRDTPQSVGLTPVEDVPEKKPAEVAPPARAPTNPLYTADAVRHIWLSPMMWLLSLACALNIGLKMAVADWLVLWLAEEKGYTLVDAGGMLFYLEAGFGVGALASGYLSDRYLGPNAVNFIFQLGSAGALLLLFALPPSALTVPALVFAFGGAVNMPGTLIGMVAAETVPKSLAATACGFVGGFGYVGAACCGYPLGMLVERFGWNTAISALIVSGAACTLTLLPPMMRDTRKCKAQ